MTRADLSAGCAATQVAHAVADYAADHPELFREWQRTSNSLIVLAASDHSALLALQSRLVAAGLDSTSFREPDLGLELTALAVSPSDMTARMLSSLPLALRRVDPAAEELRLLRESRLRSLCREMEATEQMPGLDVLAHGAMVAERLRMLLDHLEGRVDLSSNPSWRLPAWLESHRGFLLERVLPWDVLERYATMHDCGKPAVRVLGEDGRVRFPGHAESSGDVWRALGDALHAPGSTEALFHEQVERLIRSDMDVHLLKDEGVAAFAHRPEAVSLLLTGLAEVHANASMFGGVDSVGFKSKWKHLDRRGRAILRALGASS